jgi:phosphoglycerate-specific signal transduction histidine kinase
LRDAQGKITHFVATGKDITEHKLDEEKLRKAFDDLELRVQERTEELQIANSELEDEINVRRRVEAELTQFNNAMVGRELRMIELKKEVNELCESLGQRPPYALDFNREETQ